LLSYAGISDCKAEGEFTEELKNKTKAYMNKITQSLAAELVPNSNPILLVVDDYSLYANKIGACQLNENYVVEIDEQSP